MHAGGEWIPLTASGSERSLWNVGGLEGSDVVFGQWHKQAVLVYTSGRSVNCTIHPYTCHKWFDCEGGFERWQVPSACLQHRRLTCIHQSAPLLAMVQQSLAVFLLGVVAYRLDPRGDPVFQIHLHGGVAQIKQRFACNKWMIWIYKILWLGTDKLINYIQQQWDGVNFITLC